MNKSLDPSELGYFEMRPGSGIWYHPDRGTAAFDLRTCESPACHREFMGRRSKGRGRFCSLSCRPQNRCGRPQKADAGYGALHLRVHKARGKASEYPCVDCGQPAYDWSRIHGRDGKSIWDYQPRCRKCHRGLGGYDDESQPRGEAHYAAKLTEAIVRECRARYADGESSTSLAVEFGVNQAAMSSAIRGATWKRIEMRLDVGRTAEMAG